MQPIQKNSSSLPVPAIQLYSHHKQHAVLEIVIVVPYWVDTVLLIFLVIIASLKRGWVMHPNIMYMLNVDRISKERVRYNPWMRLVPLVSSTVTTIIYLVNHVHLIISSHLQHHVSSLSSVIIECYT